MTTIPEPLAAAALNPASDFDSVIGGLPGVLLGGLALVFAVRERSRSRRLSAELEVERARAAELRSRLRQYEGER